MSTIPATYPKPTYKTQEFHCVQPINARFVKTYCHAYIVRDKGTIANLYFSENDEPDYLNTQIEIENEGIP